MNISPKAIYDWYRSTLRNPKYRWWVILGSLVYIISPIDIAPDFLPIVGQIDDLMILTLLISEVSQLVLDFAKTKKENGMEPEVGDAQATTVNVDAVPMQD